MIARRRAAAARFFPTGDDSQEKQDEHRLKNQTRAEVNGSNAHQGDCHEEEGAGSPGRCEVLSGRDIEGEIAVRDVGVHGGHPPNDFVFSRL